MLILTCAATRLRYCPLGTMELGTSLERRREGHLYHGGCIRGDHVVEPQPHRPYHYGVVDGVVSVAMAGW